MPLLLKSPSVLRKGVERTGSPVGFGLGAGALIACGEVLISVRYGMAVDWLVPDVDAGGAVLRQGSCSIDGKDSADGSTAYVPISWDWTASGQQGCVGVVVLPSPPVCSVACSPELAVSSPLPDQVAEGHAVRCFQQKGHKGTPPSTASRT
jgi:hypothetical protein